MLAPCALNTTKNPVNFCSTYFSPVPKKAVVKKKTNARIIFLCSFNGTPLLPILLFILKRFSYYTHVKL